MSFKEWKAKSANKELAKEIADECGIDPFIALLCLSRGLSEPEEIDEFLSDELIFSDPFELPDMEKAAEIINTAAENDELVAVYGDYDCDGVTATALLYTYLTDRGIRTVYRIPDRADDGYGLNEKAIDELFGLGVNTLITVDNGITANKEVAYAKELGMKAVITDHHLPADKLPDADAVVDPHRTDCFCEFKEFCGVGVAFKLICALEDKSPEELIEKYADLVAIGTVGDVMPLINENRSFVRAGIEKMQSSASVGIEALFKVSGVKAEELTATKLAFSLVPRINAAGRMGSADRAFRLLISSDTGEADRIAEEISKDNSDRQQIEKEILTEAVRKIEEENLKYDRVIVVSGENWHKGVVGIVAARICEKYSKPAIVLSLSDGMAAGSGRSYDGFSLFEALKFASGKTEKFGGHDLAAGVTLKEENITGFRNALNEYAEMTEYPLPALNIDCRINPAVLSIDFAEELKTFEPFGHGNPVFVFGIYGTVIERITELSGNKHIKMTLSKNGSVFQAVLFGVGSDKFPFSVGDTVDTAVTVDINRYSGRELLSVQIKSIRKSGTDDENAFDGIRIFDDVMRGKAVDGSRIIPSREEFAAVYKYINSDSADFEKVLARFTASVGAAKTLVILETFKEVGLIKENPGNKIFETVKGVSVDLNDALIMKRLKGEVK